MADRMSGKAFTFLSRFSIYISRLSIAFGVMVLAGWTFHIQTLKGLIPGQVPVKANTAVCFVLIGTALWLTKSGIRKRVINLLSTGLALLASSVGLLSFLEFWKGWDLGIDQLLFTAGPEDLPGSVRMALMSPLAAADFFLLGIAIPLLDIKGRWSRVLQNLLPAMAAVSAIFGLLDFLLDPQSTHTHIAPMTALVLLLFSFAVLCAPAERGLGILLVSETAGGLLCRRLLPSAIVIPIAIGWLRWRGQLLGLYSEWTGLVIMTVSASALLAALTLWTAFVLERVEAGRARAEESARRLAAIVTSSNDGIIGKTLDGTVTSWNPGAEAIYGYSEGEMVGQSVTRVVPPDMLQEFHGFLKRLQRGETIRHHETERIRKDGKRIFISLSLSPLRDDKGRVVGAATIVRDITDRKQVEQKLARVNQTLQALSACTDSMMRASDESVMLQQVCEAAIHVGGYRMAWVGYAEHDQNKNVRPMAHAGLEAGYLLTANITWADVERGRGPTGNAVRTGKVFVSRNLADDPKIQPWRTEAARCGFRSSIALPLRSENQILGAITIYSGEIDAFDSGEQQLLDQLASNLSYAIMTLRARAQRDRSEQKLRESALYARSLIEASLDPLVTISKEGKITDVNQATEKATGVARERLIGSDFSDYFTNSQKAREGYQLVFEKGFVRDYPLAIRSTGGKVMEVLYNASIFRNEAGDVEGVLAAARDITERQRAESALKESESNFRTLANLVPQLVWMCKPDGLNVYFNQRWFDYTGLSPEQSYGRNWSTPFHPDDQQVAWAAWNQAVATGDTYRVESRLRAASGNYRWFLMRGVPLRDEAGNVVKWFGTCTDIDEMKRAEAEIRELNRDLEKRVETRTAELWESEQRVRRKLDSILTPEGDLGTLELADVVDIPTIQSLLEDFYKVVPVTTGVVNLKGEVLAVPAWQRICQRFHRSHPEACKNCVESDLHLSEGLAPGEFKAYRCKNNMVDVATPIMVGGQHMGNLYLGQFLFADEPIDCDLFRAQARHYGFDEKDYLAALDSVPRLTRDTVEACMAFLASLAQVVSQLSYSTIKLARSTEQAGRSNIQLAAANKELEAFTYSVSHDLRAPLRHISGFSKILSEEFAGSLPPEARHHVHRIQEGTLRMGQLVDDLLNLGRVGRKELSRQVAGLRSIVEDVIESLKADVGDRRVEWRIGDLPYVECDTALMRQVLHNLLSNALKFTRPRSPALIEIGQEKRDGKAVIYVRDNGVGFSMKYVDKLFGVFQRLHRAEDFEGTGVGLATVQRIIQKHGGIVWAEGELDQGATFYFTLNSDMAAPAWPAAAAAAKG